MNIHREIEKIKISLKSIEFLVSQSDLLTGLEIEPKEDRSVSNVKTDEFIRNNVVVKPLVKRFYEKLGEIHPKMKKPTSYQLQKEYTAIRLLCEVDNYSIQDIIDVFDWLFNSTCDGAIFWRANVYCVHAMRSHKNGISKFYRIFEQSTKQDNNKKFTLQIGGAE